MGFAVSRAVLAADVPVGGTFLVPYPRANYVPPIGTFLGTLITGSGNRYANVLVGATGTSLLVVNGTGRVLFAGESVALEVSGDANNTRNSNTLRPRTLRRGVPLLAYPRSSADHQAPVGFGGGSTPTSAYEIIDGIPVLSLTTVGGACQVDTLLFSRQIPLGRVHVLFRCDEPANLSNVQLLVGDNSFANHFTVNNIASTNGWPGWVLSSVEPPATGIYSTLSGEANQRRWAVGTGTPDFASTTFTSFRVRITPVSGGVPVKVSVAGVWVQEQVTVSPFVLSIDDGYASAYDAAAPIAERYGLRLSMGIISELVGNPAFMTTAQLRELVARGHECVPHGNPQPSGNLTSLSSVDAVENEVRRQQEWLTNQGLERGRSNAVFVYPQGVYQHAIGDTRIIDGIRRRGIIAARRTNRQQALMMSPEYALRNRWYIDEIGHRWDSVDEPANVARVILRMQQAATLGRGGVLTFHRVVSSPADVLDISLANFDLICRELATLINAGTASNLLLSELGEELEREAMLSPLRPI